jgi:hypothetical protein
MMGWPGKWPWKIWLIRGHGLARDNAIPVDELDVVNHEKGRSVGQNGFDGAGIELHGPRYFFLLCADLAACVRRGLLLARVVAPDDLVGEIQMRLGKHYPLVLVENHGEVFGPGDLGYDPLQAVDDGPGGLLFL